MLSEYHIKNKSPVFLSVQIFITSIQKEVQQSPMDQECSMSVNSVLLTTVQLYKKWRVQRLTIRSVPSVLWRCWLGGRKGIRPVKNWVVRCWRGYLSGARCRLAQAQLMPLPLTVSCFSKIQIGFTFLVPAHPGSPGKRAVKRVCVCSIIKSAQKFHYLRKESV